jgi:hypothetical protein
MRHSDDPGGPDREPERTDSVPSCRIALVRTRAAAITYGCCHGVPVNHALFRQLARLSALLRRLPRLGSWREGQDRFLALEGSPLCIDAAHGQPVSSGFLLFRTRDLDDMRRRVAEMGYLLEREGDRTLWVLDPDGRGSVVRRLEERAPSSNPGALPVTPRTGRGPARERSESVHREGCLDSPRARL